MAKKMEDFRDLTEMKDDNEVRQVGIKDEKPRGWKEVMKGDYLNQTIQKEKTKAEQKKLGNLMRYGGFTQQEAEKIANTEKKLNEILKEKLNSNNFFELLFGVQTSIIAKVLEFFGFGGEIMNSFIKNIFGTLKENDASMFASVKISQDLYSKTKDKPIEKIRENTKLSSEYKYLLQKNRLEALENLNSKSATVIKEIRNLRNEINDIEEKNNKNPKWMPFIATKIGEYPKNEIEIIFNELSFERKKEMISTLRTNLIADGELKNKIIDLQKATNDENFMKILGELKDTKAGEMNGAQFLLGMVDIKKFEEIKKDDLEAKLRLNSNTSINQKMMIENTAINPNIEEFLIDPPRGILGSDKKLFQNMSLEGFKMQATSEYSDKFLREVWTASGLTSSQGELSAIRLADRAGIAETLAHEGHHGFMRTTGYQYLNDFAKIHTKTEDEVHKSLHDSLKKYSGAEELKIGNPKVAIEEKIEEMLKIFGLERSEENAEEYDKIATEIKEMILGLTEMYDYTGKGYKDTMAPLKYDIAQLLNAVLTFQNLEQYPLGKEVKRNAMQFLNQEEDLKEKWKLAKEVFHDPDLLQNYKHSHHDSRVEESISRVKENMDKMETLFPKTKESLNKLTEITNKSQKLLEAKYLPKLTRNFKPNFNNSMVDLRNCDHNHTHSQPQAHNHNDKNHGHGRDDQNKKQKQQTSKAL